MFFLVPGCWPLSDPVAHLKGVLAPLVKGDFRILNRATWLGDQNDMNRARQWTFAALILLAGIGLLIWWLVGPHHPGRYCIAPVPVQCGRIIWWT